MRGWKAVAVASVLLMLIGLAVPRRAEAYDFTKGLIIGGITAGVVATVLLIAILVAGNKEPEPELMGLAPMLPRQPTPGVRVGCAQPDGTRAVVCW